MKVANFKKVSLEQFTKDVNDIFELDRSPESFSQDYESIELPKRATAGSAGHDFKIPFDLSLSPGHEVLIPTGIRCEFLNMDWVLKCYPRSGHGTKFGIQLMNTVGIIDADYYFAKNEGHIMFKLKNTGDKTFSIEAGESFAQGVFVQYGTADEEEILITRVGGFGSTSVSLGR